MPVPVGFGEQDLRSDAPRLFSDIFILFYFNQLTRANMTTFSDAIGTSTREDIIEYFEACLDENVQLYEKSLYMLLEKRR
nr:DUF3231 family protein [Piscibacillus salipiscarius]